MAAVSSSATSPVIYFRVRNVHQMVNSAMDAPSTFDASLYFAVRFLVGVDVFWDEDLTQPIEEVQATFPHVSLAAFGVRASRQAAKAAKTAARRK